MRTTQLLTTAVLLALGACAPAISVRTALTPDVSLHGLRTFRVQPTPKPKIAGAVSSTNDPMLVNSISNRALRNDLVQEFAGLGYVASDSTPDSASPTTPAPTRSSTSPIGITGMRGSRTGGVAGDAAGAVAGAGTGACRVLPR